MNSASSNIPMTVKAAADDLVRRVKRANNLMDTVKGWGSQAGNWLGEQGARLGGSAVANAGRTAWAGLGEHGQRGLMGAGLGGAAGLALGQFAGDDDEPKRPWSSALTGALAGGALGVGGSMAYKGYKGVTTPDPDQVAFESAKKKMDANREGVIARKTHELAKGTVDAVKDPGSHPYAATAIGGTAGIAATRAGVNKVREVIAARDPRAVTEGLSAFVKGNKAPGAMLLRPIQQGRPELAAAFREAMAAKPLRGAGPLDIKDVLSPRSFAKLTPSEVASLRAAVTLPHGPGTFSSVPNRGGHGDLLTANEMVSKVTDPGMKALGRPDGGVARWSPFANRGTAAAGLSFAPNKPKTLGRFVKGTGKNAILPALAALFMYSRKPDAATQNLTPNELRFADQVKSTWK